MLKCSILALWENLVHWEWDKGKIAIICGISKAFLNPNFDKNSKLMTIIGRWPTVLYSLIEKKEKNPNLGTDKETDNEIV